MAKRNEHMEVDRKKTLKAVTGSGVTVPRIWKTMIVIGVLIAGVHDHFHRSLRPRQARWKWSCTNHHPANVATSGSIICAMQVSKSRPGTAIIWTTSSHPTALCPAYGPVIQQ